jgi:hypothetical protein
MLSPAKPAIEFKKVCPARGSVRNFVRWAGFPSCPDEAFTEQDGELCLGLGPFARRHFPFLATWRKTEKMSFVAASSLGKWPRARTARRSLAFKASIRSEGEERDDLLQSPRYHAAGGKQGGDENAGQMQRDAHWREPPLTV